MNNAVFEKLQKLSENRIIKFATTEKRRHYLVLELKYHATKFFTKNLLAIEMGKNQILMNKPGCLRL